MKEQFVTHLIWCRWLDRYLAGETVREDQGHEDVRRPEMGKLVGIFQESTPASLVYYRVVWRKVAPWEKE